MASSIFFRDVRRMMIGKDVAHAMRGALERVGGTLFGPLVRTATVADRRVQVLGLHQLQRL